MKKILALGTMALLSSASLAMADHHGGDKKSHHDKGQKMMERMFEKSDTDGDGVISKAEFMAEAEARFAKMDADSDGNVTKDEAKAHHEAMKAKWKEKKEKMKAEKEAAGEAAPEKAE